MFCHLPGSFLVYGQVSRKGEVTKTPMIWKGLRSISAPEYEYEKLLLHLCNCLYYKKTL